MQPSACEANALAHCATADDRSRAVEFLVHLENKQQIMPNKLETQHKPCIRNSYIGGLCNVVFPMTRFTCIVTSQVFVNILMP